MQLLLFNLMGSNGLFLIIFAFFKATKTVVCNRIRTRIVRTEGKHADRNAYNMTPLSLRIVKNMPPFCQNNCNFLKSVLLHSAKCPFLLILRDNDIWNVARLYHHPQTDEWKIE